MPPLRNDLRRLLEKTVIAARRTAEVGARAALARLAVGLPEPFAEMSSDERKLRVHLRAHARQLGDERQANGEHAIEHLVMKCAYEHWHCMLFARFLAENDLLMHPEQGVPVSLAECEELAGRTGVRDGWRLASNFAARMLPAIFRTDDPVLQVRLATEHQQPLEQLLACLPAEIFTADDSLGWAYQYWQSKQKQEINESGRKIGADELPAVTQLFTEPYMVKFLLHNTLGAWWAAKKLSAHPELAQKAMSEDDLRQLCSPVGYELAYLRFIRTNPEEPWQTAAGSYESWPNSASEITVLDPCCGSGHFLVEAFQLLVVMRAAEEKLSARNACDAVLRDNLFGLEVDERCTQIAAFCLALAAWTYPGAGGYRQLPELHVACSGIAVAAKEEEWARIAGKDELLRTGMRRLHQLFREAPTLGSLVDPRREDTMSLFTARFDDLSPLLTQVLSREQTSGDAHSLETVVAAQGMAKAAALMSSSYTLVTTNVPYLHRKKHGDTLSLHLKDFFPRSREDLATAMLERCLSLCTLEGVAAVVAPQHALLLKNYSRLRTELLSRYTIDFIAALGPRAFGAVSGEVVNVALYCIRRANPRLDAAFVALDANSCADVSEKDRALRQAQPNLVVQSAQLRNPNQKILLSGAIEGPLLDRHAKGLQGIATADYDRFGRCFWEVPSLLTGWAFQQSTVQGTQPYGGREHILWWQDGKGELASSPSAYVRGRTAWGKAGVAVAQMSHLPVTLYSGEAWDNNTAVILPRSPRHLAAVWAFCSSPSFSEQVRRLDKKINVTNATLAQVPFDLEHWEGVARHRYPSGLPEPQTNDPTQWLFHGHPVGMMAAGPGEASPIEIADPFGASRHPSLICRTSNAADVLQVAVARLVGYRWPAESDPDMRLGKACRAWANRCTELHELADPDGIACIPAIAGEQPASERLQTLLARAFGQAWSAHLLVQLLREAGSTDATLEEWLRDSFFGGHCSLFHQRPFVWHIWDGRRDGFAALVNYHKLDRRLLERLTYAELGDWISRQREDAKAGERSAAARLAAAEDLQRRLGLILKGDPPYDIFVRWKPLHLQAVGWEPDVNDGVRTNIRPFVRADVLRKRPGIKWAKDRGREIVSMRSMEEFPWFWRDGVFTGDRVNDVSLTNAQKLSIRQRVQAMPVGS